MPVPRKRSCAQCRLAKTRCSLTSPQCSRCLSRTLDCDYSEALPNAVSTGAKLGSWSVPPVESQATPTNDLEQVGMSFMPDLEMNENGPLRWGEDTMIASLDDDSEWLEYTFVHNTQGIDAGNTSGSSQSWFSFKENIEHSYLAVLSQKLTIPLDSQVPWPPPKDIPIKFRSLLSRKQTENLGHTLVVNHLLANFRLYSKMLCKLDLPPFIHSHCYSKTVNGNTEVYEPLANCVAFLPMFWSKTRTSNKFVMRTLFNEVQRLHNEFTAFDGPMQLAALQALAIYIIILVDEEERCPTLATVIVVVMGEIASTLQQNHSVSHRLRGMPSWEEWAFDESLGRTLTVLWILQMVIETSIGVSKSSSWWGLDRVPLPSSKELWEAGSQSEWTAEYQKYLSSMNSREHLNVGDLKKAQHPESASVNNDPHMQDLQVWSSNTDSFGSMIMMAIRIVH